MASTKEEKVGLEQLPFEQEVILHIVRELITGASIDDVSERYKIEPDILLQWPEWFQSMEHAIGSAGSELRQDEKQIPAQPEFNLHIDFCHTLRLDESWHGYDLFSPFWRLYVNKTSGAALNWNDETIPLRPKNLYVIPQGTPCKGVIEDPTDQFFIHFHVSHPFHHPLPGIYEIDIYQAVNALVKKLDAMSFIEKNGPQGQLLCTALVATALGELDPEAASVKHTDERVLTALKFVNNNYARRITIDQMAESAGMSRASFYRLFTSEMGTPPHTFLLDVRVEKGRALLESTRLSLDDIAQDCGFSDRFHFSKVFKKKTGYTPGSYRKTMGGF